MKHLLVDITAHGFGHLAQTAPVVNALKQHLPELRVTVRSAAPAAILKQRFHCDFRHISQAIDFGMHMQDAVRVDVESSLSAYRDYHADWERRVAVAAEEMRLLRPDVLLANVPYLSLAAAQHADIPAVAMCCLNWADIYHHYAPDNDASRLIHHQILSAYQGAEAFLKVQPAMPMPDLSNGMDIAPIAQSGACRREEIEALLGMNTQDKLVLVGMGGINYQLDMQHWPQLPGVHWLVPAAWQVKRKDVHALEHLGMSFSDALASSDAVLTKPGYGTFAEAACAGVPVLYVPRGDWPEQPWLVQWLEQHGVGIAVDEQALCTGSLESALRQVWQSAPPVRPQPTGADQAAVRLLEFF